MADAALVRLAEVDAFERPLAVRFPFRIGVARVTVSSAMSALQMETAA
jgi:hypothetical protein